MKRLNHTSLTSRLFVAFYFKVACVSSILCLLNAISLEAQTEMEEPSSFRESIGSLDPMDVAGLDPDVASILSEYYRFNFTSEENWSKVESIRFEGGLRLADGQTYRFNSFQKKPNYSKTVIYKEGKPLLIMAYDGVEAWTLNCAQSTGVVSMSEAEALDFIRDAATGGPLHYPQLKGKVIESRGTKVVRGRRCYELLITQPNGEEITSMIDATSFDEFQRIATNVVDGMQQMTTNIAFKVVDGVRIPIASETRVDGELRHTVDISDVKFNSGVSPWMFSRESVAHLSALDAGEGLGSGLLYSSPGEFLGQQTAGDEKAFGMVETSFNELSPFTDPPKADFSADLREGEQDSGGSAE